MTARNVYTVEIDGQQVDIEGDHPPNESEARAALAAHTGSGGGTQAPDAPGPVARFMAPIGTAIAGVAHLPAALAHGAARAGRAMGALTQGNPDELASLGSDAFHAVADPTVEHAQAAGTAFGSGDSVEGARQLIEAVPVAGPVVSDVRASADSGDIAGALGKTVVAAAPFARAPEFAAGLSNVFKQRAAARILDVMRPTLKRVATAEKIAPEVVGGTAGREIAGGIGVGTRKTLALRAQARAALAGKEVEAFQALDTPVDTSEVAANLREEAARSETVPPPSLKTVETPTGLVDPSGAPIMSATDTEVPGTPVSDNPALVASLRRRAQGLDDLAAQYPDGATPAGELFKQRAVLGKQLGNRAYEKLPGDLSTADVQSGKARNTQLTRVLHDQIPGSAISDHDYHVWSKAALNLENSRLRDMLGRGGKQVVNLLAGRLAGAALGGATGLASGYGPMAGVAGATLGVVLGESAYWGSLRAATYSDIAKALRAGNVDAAATIIQRTAAAYAVDKGIKDRERNRKAQLALQNQAAGSPAP